MRVMYVHVYVYMHILTYVEAYICMHLDDNLYVETCIRMHLSEALGKMLGTSGMAQADCGACGSAQSTHILEVGVYSHWLEDARKGPRQGSHSHRASGYLLCKSYVIICICA